MLSTSQITARKTITVMMKATHRGRTRESKLTEALKTAQIRSAKTRGTRSGWPTTARPSIAAAPTVQAAMSRLSMCCDSLEPRGEQDYETGRNFKSGSILDMLDERPFGVRRARHERPRPFGQRFE